MGDRHIRQNAVTQVENPRPGSPGLQQLVDTPVQTGPAGRFLITALQPGGPYLVAVQSDGFKRMERSGIMLEVEQAARITIPLEVGALTETIEVTGELPLLETTTSSM